MASAAKRRTISTADDDDKDAATRQCIICLADHAVDRTRLPACSHSAYCFLCIVGWATLPRGGSSGAPACPLCKTAIGPYVLHHLRGNDEASRYYLRPPQRSPSATIPSSWTRPRSQPSHRRPRPGISQGQARSEHEDDALERTLAFRRQVYQHLVFSQHIASNRYTRFRPMPPPSAFRPPAPSTSSVLESSSSLPTVGVSNWSPAQLQSRVLAFVRRELLIFPHLTALDSDTSLTSTSTATPRPRGGRQSNGALPTRRSTASLSFVTTYILSLLQTLDLRSDTMTQLLAEFIRPLSTSSTPPTSSASHLVTAELFAHELGSWIRSPYKRLEEWDRSEWLQYDFWAGGPLILPRTRTQRSRGQSSPISLRPRSPPSSSPSRASRPITDPTSPSNPGQDQVVDQSYAPPHHRVQTPTNLQTTDDDSAPSVSRTAEQSHNQSKDPTQALALRTHLLARLEAERALARQMLAQRLSEISAEGHGHGHGDGDGDGGGSVAHDPPADVGTDGVLDDDRDDGGKGKRLEKEDQLRALLRARMVQSKSSVLNSTS